MQLSIVICTLRISNLTPLLKSLNFVNNHNYNFEIIIVNQSADDIAGIIEPYSFKFKEVVPKEKLSASAARNYGASFSESNYLFFMDDDAFFINMNSGLFDNLLKTLTEAKYVLYVAQRGEIDNNGNYLSHWPNSNEINIRNFPRFVIEWNIIIKRTLFDKIGGFYNVGTGSKHLAQAGEAFLLIVQVLSNNFKIFKLNDVFIAHPSLYQIDKEKQKKYIYGTGYTIGYSIQYMTAFNKICWFTRAVLSSLKQINFGMYMLRGLFDGLKHKPPRVTFSPINF